MHKPSAPDNKPVDDQELELPAIEFVAQGSFSIHNPNTSRPSSSWEPADYLLGKQRELIKAHARDELRSHTLALLQQAQHSLCIYSPDLEHWLYNHSCIQQACSTLLLAHPKNSLRILLHDTSKIVREGHALLSLSHRLSSRCQIRKVNLEHEYSDDAWLIADDCGLLVRKAQQLSQGVVYYHDPARVQQSQRLFNAMWDVSHSDVNLRSMPL
ncbi:MAG TPA: histone acetyltransferase HPA2 [Gammaproteobacteria bacterium]|nr:histone acetyltransferase HPA2 [Gammaproteobacteria bacterium]